MPRNRNNRNRNNNRSNNGNRNRSNNRKGKSMPVVHVAMKSSSKAPPAAAHADYILREGSYARRDGLVDQWSDNMPEFAKEDPRRFWEAADAYERVNGRTYTELQIALPRELSPEQRNELAREAVREFLGDRYAYTIALHAPLAKDNIEQPHMHLMFSERAITEKTREIPEEQFFKRNGAKKDPEWNDREKPSQVREQWCEMMNRAMERAHVPERVSPLSWRDQGRDDLAALVEPKTLRGDTFEPNERNAQIDELRAKRAELPPPQLDGPAAGRWLEDRAESKIAAIQRTLAAEISRIEKAIATVKEAMAKAVEAVRQMIKPSVPTVSAEEMRYVQLFKQIDANVQKLTPEETIFFHQAHRKHRDNLDVLINKVERGAQVMQTQQSHQVAVENPWKALEDQFPSGVTPEAFKNWVRVSVADGQEDFRIQQMALQWTLSSLAKHPQVRDYIEAQIEAAKEFHKSRGPELGREKQQDKDYER